MREARLCSVGFVFLVRTLAPAACDPQKVPLHNSSIAMRARAKRQEAWCVLSRPGHPQRLHQRGVAGPRGPAQDYGVGRTLPGDCGVPQRPHIL